jgi:hypothetical protein
MGEILEASQSSFFLLLAVTMAVKAKVSVCGMPYLAHPINSTFL